VAVVRIAAAARVVGRRIAGWVAEGVRGFEAGDGVRGSLLGGELASLVAEEARVEAGDGVRGSLLGGELASVVGGLGGG